MRENSGLAFEFVLRYEGGYSDHPSDPGGATNLGITRGVLASFRGRAVSKADMRALELSEAEAIYVQRYWEPCRCGFLPSGIDLAVFDCAVNQGVSRATRFLQQAARVKVDGIIGPITLQAVAAYDPDNLLNEFMALRMQAYGRLTNLFRTFGLGWSRRLIACHGRASQLLIRSTRV